jgi:chemotaxis protein MotB
MERDWVEKDVFQTLPGTAWEGRADDQQAWTVPWSDLMMTMFILFAVLFATTALDREVDTKPGGQAGVQAPVVIPVSLPLPGEVVSAALDVRASSSGRMQRTHEEVIAASVHFSQGSAELDSSAENSLRTLSKELAKVPRQVVVVGHAADEGEGDMARALSLLRADAVAGYLMHVCGLPPSRVTVSAQGVSSPLVPGESRISTARNRRADICLSRVSPDSEEVL